MLRSITIAALLLAIAAGCEKGKEPAKAEPAKAEPAKAEPAKAEPAKAEPAKAEPAAKAEPDALADAVAAKAKQVLDDSEAGKQLKDLAAKGEQLKDTLEDKAPPLTPERYEELVVALASCQLKEGGIDSGCEKYTELQKAKQNKASLFKDLAGMHSKLGRKHMGHKSPAVRYYAVGLMGSAFAGGVAADDVAAIIKAAKKEKDIEVLAHMIDTIGSNQAKNPAVGKFLLGMLRHKQARIRKAAISELAAWGKKTKGVVPAFTQVLKKEKDPAIKAYACERAGELESDKLLPVMRQLATSKKSSPDLHEACFKGIVNMWTRYVHAPEKPSKKAYQATLALLEAKPRDDNRPPWTIVSYFNGLQKPDAAWSGKAGFFKKPQFHKAVSKVIGDPKANWMARTGFVDLLANTGAPKQVFADLRKACKAEGDDSHVVKKLDEVLAKTP
ncbi:MAG: HEAT repeat domain-containing protein [Deltaproteobacteria bacterium]|nr:HEAT repeat domain-containing protein [Deltaproteobacteria bacterium]